MELTSDQKDFFETFGFLVFRQLLTPDEVANNASGVGRYHG